MLDSVATSAVAGTRHNLPSRVTSFVGREGAIREVAGLVARGRLVTLVGAPGVGKTRLSPEVAGLVAEGLTNRQIAAWLGLSSRTIDAHLRNITGKLELSSRAQVAAWSATLPLAERTSRERARVGVEN